MFARTLIILSWGAAMAFAGTAYAWKTVELNGPGLSRDARYSGKVLTREELRVCLNRREALNAAVTRMHEEDAALSKEAAEIRKLKDEIELQEPVVDRTDPEAVARFNAMIDEVAERTQAYNAAMKKLGAQYYEHKRLRSDFAKQCGARYYEDDLRALRAAAR
ncbi:MAG: hypothetical protein IRY96_04995 [Burkholderiales bacterium]|nr:hypothetical protein [Burkholderiales bacterium]PZN03035.1 MAG: hypothetical protein DIU74_06635 [Pseudomonadota bacterium]